MTARSKFHLIIVLMAVLGHGCSREAEPKAPKSAGQTYVTRESLEPDKLASIWLIKRYADRDARFVFVADGVPLTNGILFDTPEAEFRRYANMSCFESILKKHQLTDPALRHIGELIHDIEVNYWGEKRFTESDLLERELHDIITTNLTRHETAIEKAFEVFDRQVRRSKTNSSVRLLQAQ